MNVSVGFTFLEDGEMKHQEGFTIEVSPEVADLINNDKAPFLAVSILPHDPTVPPTGEVIDLEKLYPDGVFGDETKALFVESVPADFPPTGQVRREDEGADHEADFDADARGEGYFGAGTPRPTPLIHALRTGTIDDIAREVKAASGRQSRDSDQVHAIKYGIAAAARLISAPAGWPEGQPYDRWDQIIDEMEADGAWHNFTVTRAEVRRAIQKAVGEYRLAQLDGEEYGRDDLNPDPSGDFKDLAFITTPYSDLASAAYADTAEWLDHGGMEDH